jgi:hypothetical protein
MYLTIGLAANREATAWVDGKPLHSTRNPLAEAEKYAASLGSLDKIRYILLIEAGLDWLLEPLRKRCPRAKILSLHLDSRLCANAAFSADAVWTPDAGLSARAFLERELPDTPAFSVRLVEWRPSLQAFGRDYAALFAEAAGYVKLCSANFVTARGFAKRWERNSKRNARFLKKTVSASALAQKFHGRPAIVIGSGPSLEKTADKIRDLSMEKGAFLIAVSSSCRALAAWGIAPEITLATDGGGWALFHLADALRLFSEKALFIAPLNAALCSEVADEKLFLYSDGSPEQEAAFNEAGVSPHLSLPQRGNAAAAGIDLAFALTSGPVFTAGFDMAHCDLATHVRPYRFDSDLLVAATRFCPYYHAKFERTRAINAGGTNEIYREWYERHQYPRPVTKL